MMAEVAVMKGTEPADSNVVPFGERAQIRPEEAPFTPEERALIRALLAQHPAMQAKFNAIAQGCPMAQRLLDE